LVVVVLRLLPVHQLGLEPLVVLALVVLTATAPQQAPLVALELLVKEETVVHLGLVQTPMTQITQPVAVVVLAALEGTEVLEQAEQVV
jgi:hypothetical protein